MRGLFRASVLRAQIPRKSFYFLLFSDGFDGKSSHNRENGSVVSPGFMVFQS
jgi:hypothetical protein